jgi:hypothetical protein
METLIPSIIFLIYVKYSTRGYIKRQKAYIRLGKYMDLISDKVMCNLRNVLKICTLLLTMD